MPAIDISGDDSFDQYWIFAVMNFPHDAAMRRAYCALHVARRRLLDTTAGTLVPVPTELLADLVDAPSHQEMRTRVAATTKRGVVAGDFLASIFAMHSFPERFSEPSVRKAVKISQAFARHNKFGDGSSLPSSPDSIRGCFRDFRSVAHLWAAYRLHQSFPMRDQSEILATNGAVVDFMGIAGLLQDFARWFIPKRAKPAHPLLDVDTAWLVSDQIERLEPPWKTMPSWFEAAVRAYKP